MLVVSCRVEGRCPRQAAGRVRARGAVRSIHHAAWLCCSLVAALMLSASRWWIAARAMAHDGWLRFGTRRPAVHAARACLHAARRCWGRRPACRLHAPRASFCACARPTRNLGRDVAAALAASWVCAGARMVRRSTPCITSHGPHSPAGESRGRQACARTRCVARASAAQLPRARACLRACGCCVHWPDAPFAAAWHT
jgi:hypothetical protein